MIPYSKQFIDTQDIDAVVSVLKSDFLTQGKQVPKFEKIISKYCNVNYSVAVNSATSALHIACKSLNINKGDRVWTTPISFVASANCVLHCGGVVDFIDIDSKTYNINIKALKHKLSKSKKSELPKLLIVVHLCGQPCDMKEIYKLSKEYEFKIIEDASHALGSTFEEEKIGSCKYSDITIFSFHPVKTLTTGEGGVATTKNKELADLLKIYRTHGINYEENLNKPNDEIWNYDQISLGFNFRMNDIEAALGISQFEKLEFFLKKRREIASFYDNELQNTIFKLPYQLEMTKSSYHLYPIRIDTKKTKLSQNNIFDYLLSNKIKANLHYSPIYLHSFYLNLGFKRGYCPEAEAYFKEIISIPIYPSLSNNERSYVVDKLKALKMKNIINKINKSNLAVILARGGSKRIKKKNIKIFSGKPMISWAIEAAKKTEIFNEIIVSTDDPDIKDVAVSCGVNVPFSRPKNISDDITPTADVVAHSIEWAKSKQLDFSSVCCIYASSPFIYFNDIIGSFKKFIRSDYDFAFPVTEFEAPIFRSFSISSSKEIKMFFPENYNVRSQDLPKAYHDAGQFYWGTTNAWLNKKKIFDKYSYPYLIPKWRVQDIDTPEDWDRAVKLFEVFKNEIL